MRFLWEDMKGQCRTERQHHGDDGVTAALRVRSFAAVDNVTHIPRVLTVKYKCFGIFVCHLSLFSFSQPLAYPTKWFMRWRIGPPATPVVVEGTLTRLTLKATSMSDRRLSCKLVEKADHVKIIISRLPSALAGEKSWLPVSHGLTSWSLACVLSVPFSLSVVYAFSR